MTTTDPTTAADPQATPPSRSVGPAEWVRRSLFSSPLNSLLTLIVAPVVAYATFVFLRFLFVTGRWEIIVVNLTNLMVGGFPRSELWRLWVAFALLALVLGVALGSAVAAARVVATERGDTSTAAWQETLRRLGPPLVLVATLAIFVRTVTPLLLLAGVAVLAVGGYRLGLRIPGRHRRYVHLLVLVGVIAAQLTITGFGGVPRGAWGGLLLNIYFTVGALLVAFPLGVVVALGRRSSLPVVRGTCLVYIEFFRGAPLVVLLFTGWLVLPFFLPPQFPTPNVITRVLIILVLFTSAYVAEIVRGGLQGIPRGQREAAQAVGLSPWKQTRLIILPQALRSVIPALVGQAISIFKDTTLVVAVAGLTEILGVAQNVTQQPAFRGQGYILETLTFISLIFWVGSYWMSRESQRLEARLGVGER
jgi:general L-amino acid transport system permease protein